MQPTTDASVRVFRNPEHENRKGCFGAFSLALYFAITFVAMLWVWVIPVGLVMVLGDMHVVVLPPIVRSGIETFMGGKRRDYTGCALVGLSGPLCIAYLMSWKTLGQWRHERVEVSDDGIAWYNFLNREFYMSWQAVIGVRLRHARDEYDDLYLAGIRIETAGRTLRLRQEKVRGLEGVLNCIKERAPHVRCD